MNRRSTTASLALLLALASGQAAAVGLRPLRLELLPPPQRAQTMLVAREPALARAVPPSIAGSRHGLRVEPPKDLRQRALQSVLEPAQPPSFDEDRFTSGQLQLGFKRQGNAFKDLRRGYREMCDRVSSKVWDDPKGKRVRFDIAGKPGVGIEIPLH